MSYPSMKLDAKSPKQDINEDQTSRDLEEKPGKSTQNLQMRPKSAKANEKRIIGKKKNGRPISAKKHLVNIASKLSIKPQQDAYLLTRLKPTYISIDKERLYEDNLALKLALNGLQTENIQIKTRLTNLEKELARKDDIIEELSAGEKSPGHKHVHLVTNLKQAIKESKMELKSRDEEIYVLKRNIKSTKIKEMEIQIQELEGECRRLGHNLDEALSKHSNVGSVGEYDKKFNNDLISSLKKENLELRNNFNKTQEELRKLQQEKSADTEKAKKNSASSQQTMNLKLEIQKLKAQLESSLKESRDKERQLNLELATEKKRVEELRSRLEAEEKKTKDQQKQIETLKSSAKSPQRTKTPDLITPQRSSRPAFILKRLKKLLKNQKISFQKFLNMLDKDHTGFVDVEECVKFFKSYNKKVKNSEFEYFIEKKSGKNVLNLIKLQKNYEKLEKSSSSSSSSEKPLITPSKVPVFSSEFSPIESKPLEKEIEDCLKHISLCMQLNRIEKKQIPETFFAKLDLSQTLSKSELLRALKNPPFAFPQKVSIEKLCDFMINGNTDRNKPQMQVKEIISKLEKLVPDWEIFDSEEEEKFDSELTKVIIKNKKVIKENCRKFDKKEIGTITLEEFRTAVKEFKELEKGRIFQYMTLLFYSHEYELDKVPYLHFIKAYGEQNTEESQEYSEGEKAQIVKHYLNEIAQSLKKHKQSVRDVFQVENKLIYPESFISGLEHLGMKSIEHDFIVLILEALQYEKENEACINIDEFEKIMESLGVSSRGRTKVIVESSESSVSEEIKKISIAESGNYDYSDDSQAPNKISEISPFASVSNQGLKSSVSVPKIVNKKESPGKIDPSSKMTLVVSKIENQSEKKQNSSSDSIRDILKHKPSQSSSSSSFNSKKKNQPVFIKNNELVFTLDTKELSSENKNPKKDSSDSYGYSADSPKLSQVKKKSSKGSSSSSSSSKKKQSDLSEKIEEDYDQDNFENSSSESVPLKPSELEKKRQDSSDSSEKNSKKSKKNSFTLGIEQSKVSPDENNKFPTTTNLSRSSKESHVKIESSEVYKSDSSSSSSSSKKKNQLLALKEIQPGPSSQESLPINSTGNFGMKDLPVANPVFAVSENDPSRMQKKQSIPKLPIAAPSSYSKVENKLPEPYEENAKKQFPQPELPKVLHKKSSSSSSSSDSIKYYSPDKKSSKSGSKKEASKKDLIKKDSSSSSSSKQKADFNNNERPLAEVKASYSPDHSSSSDSSSKNFYPNVKANKANSSHSSSNNKLKKEPLPVQNFPKLPQSSGTGDFNNPANIPKLPQGSGTSNYNNPVDIPKLPQVSGTSNYNDPTNIPKLPQSSVSRDNSNPTDIPKLDFPPALPSNKMPFSFAPNSNSSDSSSDYYEQEKFSSKSSSKSSSKQVPIKKSSSRSSLKKVPIKKSSSSSSSEKESLKKIPSPKNNKAKKSSSSSSSEKESLKKIPSPKNNKAKKSSSSSSSHKKSSKKSSSSSSSVKKTEKYAPPNNQSEDYADEEFEEKVSEHESNKDYPAKVAVSSGNQSSFIQEDLANSSESDEMF